MVYLCGLQHTGYTAALHASGNTCPQVIQGLSPVNIHVCESLCLNNHLLQDKDYTAAAQLAFELKQPGRLLAVVNKACEVGPAKAHHILTHLVGQRSEEEVKLCLEYIRDWNTNSRHCAVAQAMLQAILVKHPPQVRGVPSLVCTPNPETCVSS